MTLAADLLEQARMLATREPKPKQPPARLADLFLQPPTPDIQAVASAFVELQQARHDADYDAQYRFSRDDVLTLLETADQAYKTFQDMPRHHQERRTFLIALAFQTRWHRT